jgi:hypothetical protein
MYKNKANNQITIDLKMIKNQLKSYTFNRFKADQKIDYNRN